MKSTLQSHFTQAAREVSALVQSQPPTQLASAGLADGEQIVSDFLAANELGLAYEHLRYMVAESEVELPHHLEAILKDIADELGIKAKDK